MYGKVLVVDDRPLPRRALANMLGDAGFEVLEAPEGETAWRHFLRHEPDVIISDVVMPIADGHELLERVRSVSDIPFILFTAEGSVEATAAAFKAGVDEFIRSRDVDVEDLVDLVSRAVGRISDSSARGRLEHRLVGESSTMRMTRERLATLAPLRVPVLVSGESGSGCSAAVRALHDLGSTAGGVLARTTPRDPPPATDFPAAIYLDTIERFSRGLLDRWVKLISSLRERGFSETPRIFASTNRTVQEISQDPFLPNEFSRTLVRNTLELPALRTLKSDLPEIAAALASRIAHSMGRRTELSLSAAQLLTHHHWPGNIRQLESLLQRAVAQTRGPRIRSSTVAGLLDGQPDSLDGIRREEMRKERIKLVETLRRTGGNVKQAAQLLGISRPTLYYRLNRHKIDVDRHRADD